jgi:hypothetical protein
VTALITSLLGVVLMAGVVISYAKRRPPGAPLTWGEGFVGALFVFAFMLLVYAVLPSQWLTYADSTLRWRSDKIGIPTGPLHYLPGWPQNHAVPAHPFRILWTTFHTHPGGLGKVLFFIPVKGGLLWPKGVTFFGRGKVVISAQILRDFVVVAIYVIALGAQVKGWLWWQDRGKKRVQIPELTSAYGRPLVKRV